MKIIYSDKHLKHMPIWEIINEKKIPHAEVPERLLKIIEALKDDGFEKSFIIPKNFSLNHIKKIHKEEYISFIKAKSRSTPRGKSYYASYHIMDTYTPILRATFDAAVSAVDCALTGASLLTNEKAVYALCRPPGHHAEENIMGGYCYFNNAAIAADFLSKKGKVAILDIDYHHGNGTQRIFYDRNDILYISIHADPMNKFPYISGFENERGEGKGLGYTKNFPLPIGTGDKAYETVLNKSLSIIKKYNPKFLIISCGFDTYGKDPIGDFKLTIPFYKTIGEKIKRINLPTLVIQEGGYNVKDLGKIAVSFMRGLTISN